MSQDWRKRLEELAEANKRGWAVQEATQAEAREAVERAQYQRKLAKLQRRFKCHVCGKPATRPDNRRDPDNDTRYDEWDVPGDLEPCYYCHKWTCPEHYQLVDVGRYSSKQPVCIDHA